MVKIGLNQNDVKIKNRSKILKLLRSEKDLSRKDIAEKMNLTKAAISSIIAELIDEKIIVESGSKETGVIGRNKIILELNKNYGYALGLSISETDMTILVSNLLGETVDSYFYEFSQGENYDNLEIANMIIEKSLKLLWNKGIEKNSVIGFGIASIGELKVVDIEYIREQILEKLYINVISDNNVKALSMSQMDFGAGTSSDNFLFVKYGPGLGMAIVQNGKIVNGINNKAGEIGHTIADINANTTCRCGRTGCLESLISERGIVRDIEKLGPNYSNLVIDKKLSQIDYKRVNDLIKDNDKEINLVFEKRYEYLAEALANSIILLNPEYLCVYGSVFNQPYIFEMINNRLNRYLGTNSNSILRLSDLDPKNSAIGSVTLALREFFYNVGGYVKLGIN